MIKTVNRYVSIGRRIKFGANNNNLCTTLKTTTSPT
jgi:hypothetical protein